MKRLCISLLSALMVMTQLTLPVYAKEDAFDVTSLLESFKYTRDSESGTKSWHEDHGLGFELPEAYSSAEQGYISGSKNQGRTGMCWAFAMIGAMEANIRKKGLATDVDLSEAHLAKNCFRSELDPLSLNTKDSITPSYETMFIDAGFSAVHATYTLAKGVGPVNESLAPFSYDYNQMAQNVMNGTAFSRAYTLKDVEMPWMLDQESIKRLVYENGSVACAYHSNGDEYYGYVKSGGMANHIIQIVGWDDTIDRNLFTPQAASQDGAWLMKNSWGSSGEYFWLSYDSSAMEIAVPTMAPQDAYDYKYYYDVSNSSTEYTTGAGEVFKMANVFEGQKGLGSKVERIHSIGVGFASMNTVYSLQLYKNPEPGNPESGEPMLSEPLQGVKIYRGYYTMMLPESIEIKAGETISAVFTIQNRNTNHITSVEISESYSGSSYTVVEDTEPNQSYIKHENAAWKDLDEDGKCVRIHMLTNVDAKGYAPTKTLKLSDMHLRDTTLTYTGECLEPIVEFDNEELIEMVDYGIRYENNLNEGTGKVIVYGVNDYEGSSVELPFTIQGATFDHEMFNASYEKTQIATGTQIRPQVQVTYYDRILKLGTDYEITYGTNVLDDETDSDGSFTIRGLGSYTGEKTYYFNIRDNKYNKQVQTLIYPGNVAIAPMVSNAYVGEDILLTVGNTDWNYAFIDWSVDGVTFNRLQDSDRIHIYDDITLTATFISRIDMVDLLNRYNELVAMNLKSSNYNPSQWELFQKEMEFTSYMLANFDDNDMRMTQALYFLNLAYENLNHNVDRSAAKAYLQQVEANPFTWDDYETISWGEYMYALELLKAAVEDIDISQAKLDELLARVQASELVLERKDGDEDNQARLTLETLYQQKQRLDAQQYTTSSYASLVSLLEETADLLANDKATQAMYEAMIQRLNAIQLVKRGDASALKTLIDEIKALNSAIYTTSSYANLQNVLDQAEVLYEQRNDKNQNQLDTMVQSLQAAKELLALKGNKEALANLYETLKEYKAEDFEGGWDAFEVARANAKALLDDENATQEQVDVMLQQLTEAKQNLQPKAQLDKTKLEEALLAAQLYEEAPYTSASYLALQQAIQEAGDILDVAQTQNEIDEALALLQSAMDELEEWTLAPLEAIIAEAKELDAEQYESQSFDYLQSQLDIVVQNLSNIQYEYQMQETMATLQGAMSQLIKRPERVTGLNAYALDYKTIQLEWNVVEDATYYQIYRLNTQTGKWIKFKTSETNSYRVDGVKTGVKYSYRVIANKVLADGRVVTGKSSSTNSATALLEGEPILTMKANGKTKFELSWTKVEGATRYLVYRKSNTEGWKKVLTLGGDVTTYTTSSMVPNTYTYMIKAARYDSKERTQTNGSNEVSGTSTFEKPIVNVKRRTSNSVELSWNQVEGVVYYEIYRATQQNGTYHKLITTKATNYVNSSLSKGKTYYYKVRGYRSYHNQKVYSTFSEVKSYNN